MARREAKALALFILETSGGPAIRARLSEEDVDATGRGDHGMRGTIPVTFEFGDGRKVVVPLRC